MWQQVQTLCIDSILNFMKNFWGQNFFGFVAHRPPAEPFHIEKWNVKIINRLSDGVYHAQCDSKLKHSEEISIRSETLWKTFDAITFHRSSAEPLHIVNEFWRKMVKYNFFSILIVLKPLHHVYDSSYSFPDILCTSNNIPLPNTQLTIKKSSHKSSR